MHSWILRCLIVLVVFGLGFWLWKEFEIRRHAESFSVRLEGSRRDAKLRIYFLHGMSSTYHQVLPLAKYLMQDFFSLDLILINYPSRQLSNAVAHETTQLFGMIDPPHDETQTTIFCGVSLGGFMANHLARRFIQVYPYAKDRTALITIASPSGGMPLLSSWITQQLAFFLRGGITDALVPAHTERDFASSEALPPKRHLAIVANPWFNGPYWLFHGTDDGLVPLTSQKAGADLSHEVATHHMAIQSHPETKKILYAIVTKAYHSLDRAFLPPILSVM